MAEPENQQKSAADKFAREARLHLRALSAQYGMIGGFYQLTGESLALCERLLEELQRRDAATKEERPHEEETPRPRAP
jgi:hypothetical protein